MRGGLAQGLGRPAQALLRRIGAVGEGKIIRLIHAGLVWWAQVLPCDAISVGFEVQLPWPLPCCPFGPSRDSYRVGPNGPVHFELLVLCAPPAADSAT